MLRLARTIPRIRLSARRLTYNYLNFQPHQKPSRFRKFLYVNLGLVSMTAFAYYMWWPKHTFPLPVASILRKGLWAESDKGEKDYQLALKHYLEALEECKKLEMDPLCDEYTGIQLKIGEMFERLGHQTDAGFVYNEIATLYLAVLKAPPLSAQGRRIRSIDHRAHLIQRDLRIALKLVELNRQDPLLSKAILITHLMIAQDEVNRKLGVQEGSLGAIDAEAITQEIRGAQNFPQTVKIEAKDVKNDEKAKNEDEDVVLVIAANPEAWEPFSEEFFNAMDLLSAICISVGDINAASNIRISMTSKMLIAGVAPDKLLLSQCNTASLLYFQAEQMQAQEQALRRKFAETAGVDYARVKAIHDPLQPISIPGNEASEIKAKIAESVLESDRKSHEQVVANKDRLIEMVITTYESVIAASKRLPQEAKDNATIGETVALATYGLGVVNLHLSQYDKAERLLREARVRSKSCGYDALIDEIERELEKLFNEKKTIGNKDGGIEMDIVIS